LFTGSMRDKGDPALVDEARGCWTPTTCVPSLLGALFH
jgi:hypothetical protein